MKKFSASSAQQLMACPGSGNLELALPGWQEPVRDDMAGAKGIGTIVHALLEPASQEWSRDTLWAMSQVLLSFAQIHWRKRRPLEEDTDKLYDWIADNTTGNVVEEAYAWFMKLVTHAFPPRQMMFISEAMVYVWDLRSELHTTNENVDVYTEHSMQARWLPQPTLTTVDVGIVCDHEIHVVDYKNGAIAVNPEFNDQLLFYAATLLQYGDENIHWITMHILQPKNFAHWTVTRAFLERWIKDAGKAQQKILDQDLSLNPGDHCTFCPANPHSRGDKGTPLCPAKTAQLYPESSATVDEDAILNL